MRSDIAALTSQRSATRNDSNVIRAPGRRWNDVALVAVYFRISMVSGQASGQHGEQVRRSAMRFNLASRLTPHPPH